MTIVIYHISCFGPTLRLDTCMKTAGLAVAILVAVAFFWVLRGRNKPREFKSTDEFIQWLASEAVEDAGSQNHVHLDYSVESIRSVDQILGQLHDQYTKNPSSLSVNGLGSAYGAYVGEVIRRTDATAKWERGDEAAGDKSYPLIWHAGHSYPMAWCSRRIVNGAEDDIWFKYTTLRDRNAGAQGTANSKHNENSPDYQKMTSVVREIVRKVSAPADKAAFETGEVFVEPYGPNMQIVGVSVPRGAKNHIRLAFTLDYLHSNTIATLGDQALADYHHVLLDTDPPAVKSRLVVRGGDTTQK